MTPPDDVADHAPRTDELYLKLKGAREKLCRAQVLLPEIARKHHSAALERAIKEIDRVAVFHCGQWSRFDVPKTPNYD